MWRVPVLSGLISDPVLSGFRLASVYTAEEGTMLNRDMIVKQRAKNLSRKLGVERLLPSVRCPLRQLCPLAPTTAGGMAQSYPQDPKGPWANWR